MLDKYIKIIVVTSYGHTYYTMRTPSQTAPQTVWDTFLKFKDLELETTKAMDEFIRKFDGGLYPDLVKDKDPSLDYKDEFNGP